MNPVPPVIATSITRYSTKSVPLVEFAHEDQATVRSDAGALEFDLERGVEGELKWPLMYLSRWVLTSGASSSHSHAYEY